MPWPRACRRSTASTRRSSRCSSTPLFGPSRILVLGPDSSLAAIILARRCCRSRAAIPVRAVALAGVMALVSGAGVRPGRAGPARLHDRAAVEADPLRLHERHRADRADQPAAQAVRLLDRERRARCATCGRSAGRSPAGEANRAAFAVGAGTLAVILALEAVQARSRHPDRGGRGDGRSSAGSDLAQTRRGQGARPAAAGSAARSRSR